MKKAIKVIRELQKQENKYRDQQYFCDEHNFKLESQKYHFAAEALMRAIWKIQDEFKTGHVSYDDS